MCLLVGARGQCWALPQVIFTFLRSSLSLNLELSTKAKLADWQAPELVLAACSVLGFQVGTATTFCHGVGA